MSGLFQELSSSNSNVVAKDINAYVTKTNELGGYYIGRYETRTITARKAVSDNLTQITVKQQDFVYNYVTEEQAANLSRNMYNNNNFTNDLVNSYAWDTALLFIQKCSGDENYSKQVSMNDSFLEKGTNVDIRCNIYDMASNCYEWSTENASNYPNTGNFGSSVNRGGSYDLDSSFSSNRSCYNIDHTEGNSIFSFRTILYL